MAESSSVAWSPVSPPSRGKRLLFAVQRHSFLLVCLLLVAATTAFLLLVPTQTPQELAPEEIERIVRQQSPPPAAPVAERPSATLHIASRPSGATVAWDGDSVGTTPLRMTSVEAGAYILELRHDGYAAVDTIVVVRRDSMDLALTLPPEERPPPVAQAEPAPAPRRTPPPAPQPAAEPETAATGLLTVTSEPEGASILIDGSLYGRTPQTITDLPAGPHTLTLHLEGHDRQTVPVGVAAGETAYVHRRLARSTGTLVVTVRPWGSIYIDETLHELDTDVQYETRLPTGNHVVSARHPTLGTRERAVTVRAGETTHVVIRLDATADESAHRRP